MSRFSVVTLPFRFHFFTVTFHFLGSDDWLVRRLFITTLLFQNSIAPQIFLPQNSIIRISREKKQRILVRVPAIAKDINIRLSDGLGSTTLPFQNVKLSLKLKFMQILVPPHRAHKLCKPSWGKETIKCKPWDIYLHYCCHVLKSKIHFCIFV